MATYVNYESEKQENINELLLRQLIRNEDLKHEVEMLRLKLDEAQDEIRQLRKMIVRVPVEGAVK